MAGLLIPLSPNPPARKRRAQGPINRIDQEFLDGPGLFGPKGCGSEKGWNTGWNRVELLFDSCTDLDSACFFAVFSVEGALE